MTATFWATILQHKQARVYINVARLTHHLHRLLGRHKGVGQHLRAHCAQVMEQLERFVAHEQL